MRTRCSFTSAMIGKSAAMIRPSSSATRSSSPATGRWRSRSATGTTCWLTLFRLGERLGALPHVPESDVHGEHPAVQVARFDPLALLLERAAQPVQDTQADRKSTRLNSSHGYISYAVFCLKKKNITLMHLT